MTDHSDSHAHAGPSIQPYLVVFGALLSFTIISFVVNYAERQDVVARTTGFIIILSVAVVKAVLVAMYFMHLKWDWVRLYFLIIPVMVLGMMMIIVLLPDIVLDWHH